VAQPYLEKYRSSVPSTQGDQIFKRLTRESESGKISSIDEFRDRLKKLTANLLSEKIQPTIDLITSTLGTSISSEIWNDVLQHLEDDLDTAFTEAETIDEVLDSHTNLLLDVVGKSIYMAINRVESRIELYEYLDANEAGYDDALYNTFRDEDGKTARGEDTSTLFVDPRANAANTEMDTDEDAYVDLQGDRLILGRDHNEEVNVRVVKLLARSSSHHSELPVTGKLSAVNNIIDGTKNTYWIHPVLLTSQDSNVTVNLLFDFGTIRDVNSIVIEPASDSPMSLVNLSQVFEGDRQEGIPIVSPVKIEGVTKIHFDSVTTRFIVLTLQQQNGTVAQFRKGPNGNVQQLAAIGSNNVAGTPSDVAEELREALTSQNLLTDIIGLPDDDYQMVSYYQYTFGLDNIRFYNEEYNSRSVFLAKKKRVLFPGEVGIRVNETRPTQLVGSIDVEQDPHEWLPTDNYHHGAVEYWLYGEFYSDDDALLQAGTIPLLPVEATRVTHEQLVFVKKTSSSIAFENLASTQFFTEKDRSDVSVYRNGDGLLGTEWGWQLTDTDVHVETPNSGSRMKTGIHIYARDNPLDIYTISYTPSLSNVQFASNAGGLAEVIDLVGNNSAILTADNVIRFSETIGSSKIAYADFYLMIVLRRNSAKLSRTPAIEDYILLTGSRDLKKFK